MGCAALTAADLAAYLRVDAATHADDLDRALDAACADLTQQTGVDAIPVDGPDLARWQTVLLMWAARLFARRESPLGIAGGSGDLPIAVRAVDPDIEALAARLTVRAGFA